MEKSLKPTTDAPKSATAKKASASKPLKKVEKKTAVQPGKAGADTPAAKTTKAKKPKLVRDSFTIPKEEYEVLAALKQRCVAQAHPSKKSELLRAGIKALAAMNDKALLAAVQAVPSIKIGRPKQA